MNTKERQGPECAEKMGVVQQASQAGIRPKEEGTLKAEDMEPKGRLGDVKVGLAKQSKAVQADRRGHKGG